MNTTNSGSRGISKVEAAKKKTAADQKALNFKRLWKQRKQELDITQKTAAEQLGMTQGAFSQYLNGHTEMNEKAVMKLAKFLNVRPEEIDKSFKDKMVKTPTPTPIEAVPITYLTTDAKTKIKKRYLPDVFQGHDVDSVVWMEAGTDLNLINHPDKNEEEQRTIPKGSVLGCLDVDSVPYSYLSSAPRIYAEETAKHKAFKLWFTLTPPALTKDTVKLYTVVAVLFS